MNLDLLMKGCLIGFAIAMPVGPIGMLCIRNSLMYGMLCGIVSGLGAACADAFYGAIAGFGISAVSDFLQSHRIFMQILGGLFLCYLGIMIFRAKSCKTETTISSLSNYKAFITTFLLTLTNPLTIVSFAAIYAGLGIGVKSNSTTLDSLILTGGVLLGSAAWWVILSAVTAYFKDRIGDKASIWLNRTSGSLIFGCGIFALIVP